MDRQSTLAILGSYVHASSVWCDLQMYWWNLASQTMPFYDAHSGSLCIANLFRISGKIV